MFITCFYFGYAVVIMDAFLIIIFFLAWETQTKLYSNSGILFISEMGFPSAGHPLLDGRSQDMMMRNPAAMMDRASSFSSLKHNFDLDSGMPDTSCRFCPATLATRSEVQKHMNDYHREQKALPFVCTEPDCLKGFFSFSGLRHHMEAHKGYQHACNVCDSKFQHKHNLRRHMEGVHKLKLCRTCLQYLPAVVYDSHVKSCHLSHGWPKMDKTDPGNTFYWSLFFQFVKKRQWCFYYKFLVVFLYKLQLYFYIYLSFQLLCMHNVFFMVIF